MKGKMAVKVCNWSGLGSGLILGLMLSLSSCSVEAVATAGEPWPWVSGPRGEPLRLFVLGDTGEGIDRPRSQLPRTLAAMRVQQPADGILLLGDNSYPCGFESVHDPLWQQMVDPLLAFGVPVFPVLGNHDYGSQAHGRCSWSTPLVQIEKSGKPGYELWRFPAPSYVVQGPVVEIFFLDSIPIAYGWEPQAQETLDGLRAALEKPRGAPWRILAAHHPPLSCGRHGDQSKTKTFREAIAPLIGSVDLIVAGHDHDLELRPPAGAWPLILISGGGSKLRKAISCDHEGLKRSTGFATLEVTATTLQVDVFCNGEATPCLSHRLIR